MHAVWCVLVSVKCAQRKRAYESFGCIYIYIFCSKALCMPWEIHLGDPARKV